MAVLNGGGLSIVVRFGSQPCNPMGNITHTHIQTWTRTFHGLCTNFVSPHSMLFRWWFSTVVSAVHAITTVSLWVQDTNVPSSIVVYSRFNVIRWNIKYFHGHGTRIPYASTHRTLVSIHHRAHPNRIYSESVIRDQCVTTNLTLTLTQ